MDGLEKHLDRLHVLYLNSNDGSGDQHHNFFVDDIDWQRLAGLISKSAYKKPMSLETVASDIDANETASRFSAMVISAENNATS